MKNLIMLLFIYICLSGVSCALGMENSEEQNTYSIITNDQHISTIPQQHLNMCNMIPIMLGDLPNNTNPIPLPITKAMLPLLKKCLENSYIIQDKNTSEHLRETAQQNLAKLLGTQLNLHTVLSFAEQLDNKHLLKQCIEKWATTNYIPTEEYPLSKETDIAIAQRMPRAKALIDDIASWTIEDLTKGNLTFSDIAHEKALKTVDALLSIAISKNGKLFAIGDAAGIIKIYNYQTELKHKIKTPHKSCYTLQFINNDSQILSSGKGGTIQIWNLENGNNMGFFHTPTCRANIFRYIPEHELLIADSENSKLCAWNIQDRNNSKIIDAHTKDIHTLESADDGSLFVTGASDGRAHVWNTATITKITAFFCSQGAVMSTQFNHAKNKLLCGLQDGSISLYDLTTAQQIWHDKKHISGIWSILYADPNDTLFCSGSKDASIKLWDNRTYKLLETLYGHKSNIQAMAIKHEENKLISTSMDTTVKIWDLRKLLTPIKELQNELLQCTIAQINMLKNADLPEEPINIPKSCYKSLFEKFSPQAQKFLLSNENITYKD